MGLFDQFVVGGSLLVLFCSGWAFLDRGLIADHEEQDLTIQVWVPSTGPHSFCSMMQHDVFYLSQTDS